MAARLGTLVTAAGLLLGAAFDQYATPVPSPLSGPLAAVGFLMLGAWLALEIGDAVLQRRASSSDDTPTPPE